MYSRYQRAAVREANFIKYFESSEEDYGEEDEEGKEKKEGDASEAASEASGSEEDSSEEESSSDEESPVSRRKYTKKAAKRGPKPGKALVQTNLKQYVGPPKRGGRQPTAA